MAFVYYLPYAYVHTYVHMFIMYVAYTGWWERVLRSLVSSLIQRDTYTVSLTYCSEQLYVSLTREFGSTCHTDQQQCEGVRKVEHNSHACLPLPDRSLLLENGLFPFQRSC